jgi:acyl-CoA-binding protein
VNRKIRFYASLGWANDMRAEVVDMVEVGYDGWDEMTAKERENACEEYYNDSFLPNILDSGWHEEDGQ